MLVAVLFADQVPSEFKVVTAVGVVEVEFAVHGGIVVVLDDVTAAASVASVTGVVNDDLHGYAPWWGC